jgi:hypothetical protein
MNRLFIWARNRNANGRGSDPMPQLVHDDVGCAHLEIVASAPVTDTSLTIDNLCVLHPAPMVEP